MFSGFFNNLFFDGYFSQWWPTYGERDEFRQVARFEVKGVKLDGEKAVFQLQELKRRLDVKLPRIIVTKELYPKAAPGALGQRLALVYGPNDRVPCRCIDVTWITDAVTGHYLFRMYTFAATGHAFKRLRAVYVDGVIVTPATTDAAAGTFTLAEWTDGQEVLADVDGKPGSNGLMVNPSDIIKDLLIVEAGEPETLLDAESFENAGDAWTLGTNSRGDEVATLEPALCILDETDVKEVIERIERAAFALTYVGHEGTYKLKAWQPRRPGGELSLIDADVEELAPEIDRDAVITRIVAKYRVQAEGGRGVTLIVANEDARRENGLSEHRDLVIDDLPFYWPRCAEAHVSRRLAMLSAAKRIFKLTTNQALLLHEPGDVVSLNATGLDAYGRRVEKLAGLFEILDISEDATGGPVEILLSNQRGLSRTCFFMQGDETMPDGSPADPFNPAWSDAFKAYALARFGYFCDEFETIDETDPATWRASNFC